MTKSEREFIIKAVESLHSFPCRMSERGVVIRCVTGIPLAININLRNHMPYDRGREIALPVNISGRNSCSTTHGHDRMGQITTIAAFRIDCADCSLPGIVVVFPFPFVSCIDENRFCFFTRSTLSIYRLILCSNDNRIVDRAVVCAPEKVRPPSRYILRQD